MNTFVEKLKSIILYGNTKFAWFMIGVMSIVTMENVLREEWIASVLGVLAIAIFYSIEKDENAIKAEIARLMQLVKTTR